MVCCGRRRIVCRWRVFGSARCSDFKRCRSRSSGLFARLFLPCKCPVLVLLLRALGRGNRRRLRRPRRLQLSVVLNSTMSQWCCPRDGEFISMTPILQLLFEMKIKLFPRAVVVVVVVLRQFFNLVPNNFTYLLHV